MEASIRRRSGGGDSVDEGEHLGDGAPQVLGHELTDLDRTVQ